MIKIYWRSTRERTARILGAGVLAWIYVALKVWMAVLA